MGFFVWLDSREFTVCAKCAQAEGHVTLKSQYAGWDQDVNKNGSCKGEKVDQSG